MNHATAVRGLAGLAVALLIAVLSGCVSGSYQRMAINPPPPAPPSTLRAQSVLIRDVVDERSLEGELNEAPRALRSRAVGRTRPVANRPAEDVLLEGRTVEDLVRQTLTNTLKGMGYLIETDEGNLSKNDLLLDVAITDFWGWVEPKPGWAGANDMDMSGTINVTITIKGPGTQTHKREIGIDERRGQTVGVTPRVWQAFYQSLLDDFAAELRTELRGLPSL